MRTTKLVQEWSSSVQAQSYEVLTWLYSQNKKHETSAVFLNIRVRLAASGDQKPGCWLDKKKGTHFLSQTKFFQRSLCERISPLSHKAKVVTPRLTHWGQAQWPYLHHTLYSFDGTCLCQSKQMYRNQLHIGPCGCSYDLGRSKMKEAKNSIVHHSI